MFLWLMFLDSNLTIEQSNMKFILGKKLGMTQMFDQKGKIMPVTLIEAGPCFVSSVRSPRKHGYSSVQIGYMQDKNTQKLKKKSPSYKYMKEFKTPEEKGTQFKTGDKIEVSIFQKGEKVKVSSRSKGKGFQGVVKRWGFAGAPASHGHRHDARSHGAIGSAFPEKVLRGSKMAGRMGGERKTEKGLEVVKVDLDKNLIAVKGAVPGAKGGLVEIKGSNS